MEKSDSLLKMLAELHAWNDKDNPKAFQISLRGLVRTILVGKSYMRGLKRWQYVYGETYCPNISYTESEHWHVNCHRHKDRHNPSADV